MGYPLAPHQLRALDFMDSHPVGWLIYEAGTGKTIIALTWIVRALVDGRIDNALILCPASLVLRWWHEVDNITKFEEFTEFDRDLLHQNLTICSLSSIWRTVTKEIRHRDGTTSESKSVRLRESFERPWSVVIIDESHRLGSPSTNITKSCLALSPFATRRYLLTGTPDCGKYTKLYGQVKFLDPQRWRSFTEFKNRYVKTYDNFRNPVTYDVEACENLKRQYGIVATLSECFDMPDKIDSDIPCPLASPGAYNDLKKGRTSKYGLTVTATGVLPQKTYQLVSGFLKVDDGIRRFDTSKIPALTDLLDGYNGKVVIVCKFKESIAIVSEVLDTLNMSHHVFDGDSKEPTWESFQKDDSRAIIVQYQKAIGIDLFAACVMILYEPTFAALELQQTKARIWRKGQRNTCRYYFLSTPGTLEERTWKSVRAGVDVSSDMLVQWAKEDKFIS